MALSRIFFWISKNNLTWTWVDWYVQLVNVSCPSCQFLAYKMRMQLEHLHLSFQASLKNETFSTLLKKKIDALQFEWRGK